MNKYMSGTVLFLAFLNLLLSIIARDVEFGWLVALLGWSLVFLGDLEQ